MCVHWADMTSRLQPKMSKTTSWIMSWFLPRQAMLNGTLECTFGHNIFISVKFLGRWNIRVYRVFLHTVLTVVTRTVRSTVPPDRPCQQKSSEPVCRASDDPNRKRTSEARALDVRTDAFVVVVDRRRNACSRIRAVRNRHSDAARQQMIPDLMCLFVLGTTMIAYCTSVRVRVAFDPVFLSTYGRSPWALLYFEDK
jgi:hypothetical protein